MEPNDKDLFQDLVLHSDRLDWNDSRIDADLISSELMGLVDYWELPEYEGLEPWDVEKKILFEAGRNNWSKAGPHGKPLYQHMLTLIKLLFPSTDITPSLADAVMFFMTGIGGGNKKILNLIGSQNSGKSAAFCRIAFACMFVDPEYTVVYVANPFDSAADSTVWGDIEELWDELVDTHPNDSGEGFEDSPLFFPNGRKYAEKRLVFVPDIPKAGRIELRNTKHVGKYKGTKQRGKDVNRGIILVGIDEVNEIPSMAFLTTLTNIQSQDGFFSITSQNFKDEEDMGGRLTEPRPLFDGPSSFEELDIEKHLWWHSAASSVTLRFDGHRSPNILSGRTIYPKLFKESDRVRLRDEYTEQSPFYYSQVRSFPLRGDEANSILSRQKITASRHTDSFYTIRRVLGRVSFCDPAFGGRDKALWGFGNYVEALVTDGEGIQVDANLLVFNDHFQRLKLVKDAIYNDYWLERLEQCGMPLSDIVVGSDVSFEDQIAIQCRELNRKNGVSVDSFGYDFSMRPGVITSMSKFVGAQASAFDYNGKPEGIHLNSLNKNSEDCCKNRTTELAFATADVFLTKSVRGGSFIETAVVQLSRTRYETVTGKYVAEDKKAYKERWQQVSPDNRDVLMGIVGMCRRKGFYVKDSATKSINSSGRSAWSILNSRNSGKSKIAKRLP
jgi:hypothetical protein